MTLGVFRVRANFGGIPYPGKVVKFFAPCFRVVFSDGDSADYIGHELAPLLDLSESNFYDPGLWFYDFSVIHPMDIREVRVPHVRRELWLRPAPGLG